MSFSRNGFTRSGGWSSAVGRIASCASCALFFVLNWTGSPGRYSFPQRPATYSRAPALLDQRPRDIAGGNLRLLVVEPDQLGAELWRERRAQVCLDAPVLDGNELRDLLFPLDHQPHRDALDPSRRESTANLLPEDGRDLVPDQPIQDAPRLLRVVEVAVELQRLLDRFLDGFLGDLVEEDALRGDLGPLQLLVDVPGDGLALPVGVRREQDQLRALGGGLELRDYLLLRVDHLVD